MGATPEGMGHHILLSMKMTLITYARSTVICFSAFLYHYIDSSVFLEVARRGGTTAPLAPLNPSLGNHP